MVSAQGHAGDVRGARQSRERAVRIACRLGDLASLTRAYCAYDAPTLWTNRHYHPRPETADHGLNTGRVGVIGSSVGGRSAGLFMTGTVLSIKDGIGTRRGEGHPGTDNRSARPIAQHPRLPTERTPAPVRRRCSRSRSGLRRVGRERTEHEPPADGIAEHDLVMGVLDAVLFGRTRLPLRSGTGLGPGHLPGCRTGRAVRTCPGRSTTKGRRRPIPPVPTLVAPAFRSSDGHPLLHTVTAASVRCTGRPGSVGDGHPTGGSRQ